MKYFLLMLKTLDTLMFSVSQLRYIKLDSNKLRMIEFPYNLTMWYTYLNSFYEETKILHYFCVGKPAYYVILECGTQVYRTKISSGSFST